MHRLYARDLACPQDWKRTIQSIVSMCLWHLGPSDLARHLPEPAQSEVVMVHVGTRARCKKHSCCEFIPIANPSLNSTGFHWADSGSVSLNLLVEAEGSSYVLALGDFSVTLTVERSRPWFDMVRD